MRLCRRRRDLRRLPRGFRYPGTLSPLVDARAGYRDARPNTMWAHYHHKKRAYVLGSRVLAGEIFFAQSPIVSSSTCTFHRYSGSTAFLAPLAPRLPRERQALAADVEFGVAGNPPAELLQRASQALGLAFVAIDYADLADGRAVLWEANPHFHLPPVEQMFLPAQRRLAERNSVLEEGVADFLEELCGPSGAPIADVKTSEGDANEE